MAIALCGGVYSMIHMLKRNDNADAALMALAHIQQNIADIDEPQVDAWGNIIDITRGQDNFSISYKEVPQGACKHIAKHFDRANPAFVSLSVNGTVFSEGTEEINARTIAQACTQSENALMIWIFSYAL